MTKKTNHMTNILTENLFKLEHKERDESINNEINKFSLIIIFLCLKKDNSRKQKMVKKIWHALEYHFNC